MERSDHGSEHVPEGNEEICEIYNYVFRCSGGDTTRFLGALRGTSYTGRKFGWLRHALFNDGISAVE
jgi:hypothetical protein